MYTGSIENYYTAYSTVKKRESEILIRFSIHPVRISIDANKWRARKKCKKIQSYYLIATYSCMSNNLRVRTENVILYKKAKRHTFHRYNNSSPRGLRAI